MFFLLLAIVCSTCLLLVFKIIQPRNIDKLPVIVVNYFVCGIIGTLTSPVEMSLDSIMAREWFLPAVGLGVLFISVFYMVGVSTQLNGVSTTAVAFKLSVVIPVIAAFYLYGDKPEPLKITGIILALSAIYLTSKDDSNAPASTSGIVKLLPVFVFIGSGISDAIFNYLQYAFVDNDDFSAFLITLFLTAGFIGSMMLLFKTLKTKKPPQPQAVLAGILLGFPNYGSAYFMIAALEKSGMESSSLWSLNNIGIILLSMAVAAVFFNEKLNRYGRAGVMLAVVAILLIAAASF